MASDARGGPSPSIRSPVGLHPDRAGPGDQRHLGHIRKVLTSRNWSSKGLVPAPARKSVAALWDRCPARPSPSSPPSPSATRLRRTRAWRAFGHAAPAAARLGGLRSASKKIRISGHTGSARVTHGPCHVVHAGSRRSVPRVESNLAPAGARLVKCQREAPGPEAPEAAQERGSLAREPSRSRVRATAAQ